MRYLIIGGGVHGTFLSLALLQRAGIPRDLIAVVDPHEEPLTYWRKFTENCGMRYLRSPSSHNIETDFRAMRRFAGAEEPLSERRSEGLVPFIHPYARPTLAIFNAHTAAVLESFRLRDLRIRGRATRMRPARSGVEVEIAPAGDEAAPRRVLAGEVILAIGRSEQLRTPGWAQQLADCGGPVSHVFAPEYSLPAFVDSVRGGSRHVVVVGAGATGVQLALALTERAGCRVTLLARHEPREHMFDSNPCYIGPKCLEAFSREPDFDRRREIILAERYPGSIPFNVMEELRDAIARRRIEYRVASVAAARLVEKCVQLRLDGPERGRVLEAHHLLLATGFSPLRPGGNFVDAAIEEFSLPVASCGYPIIDSKLRWNDRIRVAGPLAELELGPTAPNIIGAHAAAKRICSYRLSKHDAA